MKTWPSIFLLVCLVGLAYGGQPNPPRPFDANPTTTMSGGGGRVVRVDVVNRGPDTVYVTPKPRRPDSPSFPVPPDGKPHPLPLPPYATGVGLDAGGGHATGTARLFPRL